MTFLDKSFYDEYQSKLGPDIEKIVEDFEANNKNLDLGYRIQSSAVFSSNIEGNTVDLNSYMNIKMRKEKFKKNKEVEEIDDLVEAYHYAHDNKLTEAGFLNCHKILSRTILIKSKQGCYRTEPIGVFSEQGLVYLAVEETHVVEHMHELFKEIEEIINSELSTKEILYFASLIHLKFVHIHPFSDGNGRAARLLEKWFLVSKIGARYWNLLSEKYYKEHQNEYYENIDLGVNFYELDYSKCIPFLLMLPCSFTR